MKKIDFQVERELYNKINSYLRKIFACYILLYVVLSTLITNFLHSSIGLLGQLYTFSFDHKNKCREWIFEKTQFR